MRAILMWMTVAVGCGGGTEPVTVEPVQIVDDALPPGRETVLFSHAFEATGGEGPLTWAIEGALPADLVFNPAAGAISGIPTTSGTFPFTVSATDAAGRSDDVALELQVRVLQRLVGCGESRRGTLGKSALIGFDDIDWNNTDGYDVLTIPLPEEDVTRVDIVLDLGTVGFLLEPGGDPSSQDVEDYRLIFSGEQIDLGSLPDLDTYRGFGDAMQLVVASWSGSEYGVTVACTDGPIFEELQFPPAEVGDAINVDYNVVGPDQGMVYSVVEGSLPPWAVLDPDSGRITGTADTVDTWEYRIRVDAPDGTFREESSGFGVYEPVAVECGTDALPFAAQQGYIQLDDSLDGGANPKGYVVFDVPVPDDVSGVEVRFTLPDGAFVTLTDPPFPPASGFGSLSASAPGGGVAEPILVGPRSWPTLEQFEGRLSIVARQFATVPVEGTVSVTCDRSPRVARAELPVLDGSGASSAQLPVLGGMPPFVFGADELPSGIALSSEGVLSTDGSASGASPLDITITDGAGASFTDTFDVPVGDAAACQTGPVLACGEALTFEEGFATYCLASDIPLREWVSVLLTVPPAASTSATALYGVLGPTRTFRSVGQADSELASVDLQLDREGWPPLDVYAGTVVPLAVRVEGAGVATVSVTCGPTL